LLHVLNSFDELYALLSLLVECYYLRTFGGSFTENFYSLKRERVVQTRDGEIPRAQLGTPGPVRDALKLRTSSDVWKNLAVLGGVPYLKRKLDASYEIHAAPRALLISGGNRPRYHLDDELPRNPSTRQRIFHYYKWFLRNVYPSVNAAYYLSILAFNLAYLFDNTKYASPLLWLIGTRVRRLGLADRRAIATAMQLDNPSERNDNNSASNNNARPRLGPLSYFLRLLSPQRLYPQVLSSLRLLLPLSIFALKFLEWWHASGFSRQLAQRATEALDLPAPVVSGMVDPPNRTPAAVASENVKSPKTSPYAITTTRIADTALPAVIPKKTPFLRRPPQAPISSTSLLPIFTVPLPSSDSGNGDACPICLNPLVNPTACQTGYVFCYRCIFRWLNGEHERQVDFMKGEGGGAAWEDEYGHPGRERDGEERRGRVEGEETDAEAAEGDDFVTRKSHSREGKWESGKGRCPITGRRVLGGTEGLRRILI
jgi:peroxin-12